MRKKLYVILAALILVAVSTVGCGGGTEATTESTPVTGDVTLQIKYDEFLDLKNITKQVEVVSQNKLIVKLGANHATGFEWVADAVISDTSVITQSAQEYVPPKGIGVGVPGDEVFTFDTLKAGTTELSFEASRTWVNGPKGEWTCKITVVVK